MAAPPLTTRLYPDGIRLEDGYQCLIAFARNASASFWEIDTGVPGMDGGEAIDTTTQHNILYRTMASRALITMTPVTCRVAFDPAVYDDLRIDLLNQSGGITNRFPDGSTLSYWGFLQKFDIDGLSEGKFPTANVTIVPTNTDPTTGVEAAPVLVSVAGT